MELRDRAVVVDERAIVGALGLGPPPLGVEQLVEGDGVGVVGRLHRLDLPLGGDAAVEVGLGEGEVGVDVADRLDEAVRGLEFLVLEAGPLPGELELVVADRRELATVRHHQLQLARERARLQDEELEASHGLVEAVRNVDTNFALAQTNFNRRVAAERQVEAVQAAYDANTVTLDQLLDAQRRRAEAESAYYRSLVDYNRSISQLHYRKGSLLEYNGVFLTEGPWPGKAYFDAHRRARQRDASLYLDYGHSRPGIFSRGAISQNFEELGADAPARQLPARDPATRPEPVPARLPATPDATPSNQAPAELLPTPPA